MAERGAETRIGISGWTYPPWRGVLYPKGLAQKRELEYASRKLNSIEINGTFYSLQRPESFRTWRETVPEDFLFAVKGGRYITHMKKLNEVATPLANFFASGVLRLGEKLGPILWQFPPNFGWTDVARERFERFFDLLPRTQADAAALARQHDERTKGRSWTETAAPRARVRHAVEVRHDSFLDPGFVALLRKHGVALVFADTAGNWPYAEDVTADFIYARLHGAEQLYASGYTDEQLRWWAARLRAWQAGEEPPDAKRVSEKPAPGPPKNGRDVFVYFDNDAKVKAPFDAMRLAAILSPDQADGSG